MNIPNDCISSVVSNPLSAMMASPGNNFLLAISCPSNTTKPDCLTTSLSDIEPEKSSDTNMTAPHGSISSKPLTIVPDL